jgi:hypothetical protein
MRCLRVLARGTASVAQTAVVRPLPAGKAIAAAIMICRCALASAPSRPEVPLLFLDCDDRLCLIQDGGAAQKPRGVLWPNQLEAD